MGFLLHSDCLRVMEKKLTNSGPLMEPADKHSIYTWAREDPLDGWDCRRTFYAAYRKDHRLSLSQPKCLELAHGLTAWPPAASRFLTIDAKEVPDGRSHALIPGERCGRIRALHGPMEPPPGGSVPRFRRGPGGRPGARCRVRYGRHHRSVGGARLHSCRGRRLRA